MKLGYARVSTEEQNLNRQLDILNSVNCDKIFAEKISGIKNERPELNKLISSLNIGDIIIITDLTRLSRSVKELFSIVEKVEEKGANIKSLKESWLDTTTPQGKLMFTIFAGISQFERDLISQRTIEGLIASRARGKKGGRPSKSKQDINLAIQMYNSKKYKISEITELTKVSKSTIYRYLNKI
ncbi:recombinase family protein [Clostridium perfringens]|uniref:Recombinase family protein n=1 Tax=Clostridium perfringens TaxID=1502 RepID=A0A133N0Z6_CLOPF|nr:recombinase family protein [Clostridium perfringens]KXA09974.1 resolvase [Clostridium perfringens]HAT4308410.1 recombinase family protein [Clostridium perfringens]